MLTSLLTAPNVVDLIVDTPCAEEATTCRVVEGWTGSATTGFDTLGPVDPVAIGVPVDFATLVLSGPPVFGTNATRVTFVP